ncbi:hypothetical protein ElyMa_002347800 [Elysia marginata]|uniref:LEM domain-containing protein n=1 Tax=Elysia marginata TaxID=1093978 RepID=A0AAV4G8C6_9GAST|nr:hypothetical protein ElyMa_002347800 [Elysia marginata]
MQNISRSGGLKTAEKEEFKSTGRVLPLRHESGVSNDKTLDEHLRVLENDLKERNCLKAAHGPSTKRPKRSRPGSINSHKKPSDTNTLMGSKETILVKLENSLSEKKTDSPTNIQSSSALETEVRPQKQAPSPSRKIHTSISSTSQRVQYCTSPNKETIQEELELQKPPTPVSIPQIRQPALLARNSPPNTLPACEGGIVLDDRSTSYKEKQRLLKVIESMLGSRGQKYKVRPKKSVPLRASPSDTMLVSPVQISKTRLQNSEYQTASVKSLGLKDNERIARHVSLTEVSISPCNNFLGSKPTSNEDLNVERISPVETDYLDTDVKTGQFHTGCDSQHLEKTKTESDGRNYDCKCTTIPEKLQSSQRAETQRLQCINPQLSHERGFQQRLSKNYKSCTKTINQGSSRLPVKASVRKCNTYRRLNDASSSSVPPPSPIPDPKSKRINEARKRRSVSPRFVDNNERIQNHTKFVQDSRTRSPPRPIADALKQKSKTLYPKKTASPSPSRGSRKRCIESSPHSENGKRAPSPQTENAQIHTLNVPSKGTNREKQIKHFRHLKINKREQENSICSDETSSFQYFKYETYSGQDVFGITGQYVSPMRLITRSKSVHTSNAPQTLVSTEKTLGKGSSLDWNHMTNKMQKKDIRDASAKSRDNILEDPMASFSDFAEKSEIDFSYPALDGRKNILLTVRPASSLGATSCFTTNQINSSPPFQEQTSGQVVNTKHDLSKEESSEKASTISEYLQNFLPFENEPGYKDKVVSIKHWLETTSFGRLSIQGSECTPEDKINQNLVGFKTECSSVSIEKKLHYENDHSSSPDRPKSVDFTKLSSMRQDSRRSSLWPRAPTPSTTLSSPTYFKLFKCAMQGSLPKSGFPVRDEPWSATHDFRKRGITERRFSPFVDKGSPKRVAAMTAAGHRPYSRKSSKNQGLRQRGSYLGGRGLWAGYMLYFCVFVVALEVVVVVFLWQGKMLPLSRIAGSWLQPTNDESRQNVTMLNTPNESETL